MNFEICLAQDNKEWDDFVDNSSQGNIFQKSYFLRSLLNPFSCYFIESGNKKLAGVVVMEDSNMMCKAPFCYCQYQGIIFSNYINSKLNHSRIPLEYKIVEFIINKLVDKYSNFNMSLAPEFKDIRPFLWYNYGKENKPKFNINNSYTSILDIIDLNFDEYLSSIRNNRRREIKKADVSIVNSTDIPKFLEIYQRMFKRNNITLTPFEVDLVESITNAALNNNFGWLKSAITDDNSIAAMSLFLYDKKRSYYLFGANEPSLRKGCGSTALMIENIKFSYQLGLESVDFVGANSPNRSDYKISFNSKLQPYWEVSLNQI